MTSASIRYSFRTIASALSNLVPAGFGSAVPPGGQKRDVLIRRFLPLLLLLAGLATPRLSAQIDTGGLVGTVKDPSGAVVSGVHIALTNEKTGVVQEAVSPSTGTYVFQSVQPGTYSLKAQFKGFGTFIEQGIEVNVQHVDTVDVPLTIGSTQTDVVVTAAAALLQSESAAVAQTIEG
jgi:hypothetical protein